MPCFAQRPVTLWAPDFFAAVLKSHQLFAQQHPKNLSRTDASHIQPLRKRGCCLRTAAFQDVKNSVFAGF